MTMVDISEIKEVRAKGVPFNVVSVKLPGKGIIRAIGNFKSWDTLVDWIKPYIAIYNNEDEIEWTKYEYFLPSYMIYGSGDIKPISYVGQGVWYFPYNAQLNRYTDAIQLQNGMK